MTRSYSQFAASDRSVAWLHSARAGVCRGLICLLGLWFAALSTNPATAAQVALTWQDNSDNETGFRIERAPADGSYTLLATTAANVASYTDTAVVAGATYNYRVCAYNAVGDSTFSNIASVALPASNSAPTISNISDRSINEDGATGAISFTVGDAETAAGSLTVTASSSNTTLVPNNAITLGGSNGNRTISITPVANQSGSTTITVTVSDGLLTGFDTFTVTVQAVNDSPIISDVGNRSISQDSTTGAIGVTLGDLETPAGNLTLSVASSNSTLVPPAGFLLGGSGANRTVTITPAAGQSGSVTITLTVNDGAATASDSFVLTVNPVAPANTAPTISNISNRAISEDGSTGAINFTVGDAETAAGSLSVSATSSNTTLVPNGAITLGGSGANRTISVTPATDRNGSATITVTVSDGVLSASDAFTVTVSAVNDAPTISNISNRAISEDGSTGAISFTVGDEETAAGSLSVSATSSNTTLVPNGAITLGGSGANRTISVTPATDRNGSATITVTVSDGVLSASDAFTVTVSAINDAPTISNISNRAISEDGSTGAINFTVGDAETAAGSLSVSATSSNTTLVPNGAIALGGLGADRTISVTPATNQSGSTTITVAVSDGTLSANETFTITVSAVNDQPTISAISDQTASAGGTLPALTFTIDDLETDADDLELSATSSNTALVAASGIAFGGSGANRTVTITPQSDQAGTTTITLTVSDGVASATEVFAVTLNLAETDDEPPTISSIPDQLTTSDGVVGPIEFTVDDGETSSSDLVITVASSNTSLVPSANVLISGSGTTRSLSVVPAAGQSGTAVITVTVSDGINSTSAAFTITVAAEIQPRMLNLSSRVVCRPDVESLIPGFVITGSSTKRVLLRAVGPTLAREPFLVPDTLANPRIVLLRREGQQFVEHATNDDWGDAANADEVRTMAAELYAFPLIEGGRDAALLLDLAPGSYTVLVDDPQMASGVVMVELYDADAESGGTTFVNMSNRGYVGVGAEVMISGFVISADGPKTVLIRAVGPGIARAPFNVPNTLADPVLELHRHGNGTDALLLTQDNWSEAPDSAEVAAVAKDLYAFPLYAGSKDAATVTTLEPGVYTVVVRGANNTTGSALVEVYAVE